jgi:hypothetical protein
MAAVIVICPHCDADVMIHPAQVNQCPFCNCLFKLVKQEGDFEDDQIYTTTLLKQGSKQKGQR